MLETRRLLLRLFTSPDAETVFCNWASDPEAARCLTWPAHENASVRAGRPQLSGGVRRLLLRYAGEETEWIEKKAAALQLLFSAHPALDRAYMAREHRAVNGPNNSGTGGDLIFRISARVLF